MDNFLAIWNSAPFKYIVFTICVLVLAYYLNKWVGESLSDSTKKKGLELTDKALNHVVRKYSS